MSKVKAARLNTLDMIYIALFAVIIAVCAWISIPFMVPFTLQTFGVFCALGLLGGKRGTLSIVVYTLLGAAGMPVFSGFRGGLGALLGTTGGYIVGFIFSGLLYWGITRLFGSKVPVIAAAMVSGLFVCYLLGTAWFMIAYARAGGPIGLLTALGWCVFPFLLPDLMKLALALFLVKRLGVHVKRQGSG